MGCDIHAYIEYTGKDNEYWMTVGGRTNMGRDYNLFAKMAGARDQDDIVMFEPRGLPEKTSLTVLWDNQLYVTEDGEGEEFCSRDNAESWVANGCSHWVRDDKSAVSHPDWHTHSWLTVAEYRTVLEADRPHGWDIGVAWWAVLAAMEEIERRDCNARLVFWFDN